MKISVFLSYPQPFMKKQKEFIDRLRDELNKLDFEARTLGVTDYDMDEPLVAIRRLLNSSNGLIAVAFRRTHIIDACEKPNSDIDIHKGNIEINDKWYSSAYCQIEPAMAFQIGLPILILREKDVIEEGILEKGVAGTYLPEFDLDKDINDYFKNDEWKQLIRKWELRVRNVYDSKGYPPKLYI